MIIFHKIASISSQKISSWEIFKGDIDIGINFFGIEISESDTKMKDGLQAQLLSFIATRIDYDIKLGSSAHTTKENSVMSYALYSLTT